MPSVTYEELLKRDGRIATHVVGTSMLPLLLNRDSIVVVEDARRVPPRRGDVVLYNIGGTYILHRVLRVESDEYIIRGDNTWTLERMPKASLLATMTGFYRHSESKLVSRDSVMYRLYCLSHPVIRLSWRYGSWLRRAIRKICAIAASARKQDRK